MYALWMFIGLYGASLTLAELRAGNITLTEAYLAPWPMIGFFLLLWTGMLLGRKWFADTKTQTFVQRLIFVSRLTGCSALAFSVPTWILVWQSG